MNKLQWECHRFDQLDTKQLYNLLKLRVDVFVVEQQCPYPELDDNDQHEDTHHLIAFSDDNMVAYCRLLPPGLKYSEASLGRLLVAEKSRQQGLGTLLLEKSIQEMSGRWPNSNIKISAQRHLKNFYEKAGFKQVSDSYLEDNIPHIEMLRKY